MWKSSAGVNVEIPVENADDDWETDPDFVNDVSEEEQRWGSRTIPGSGRVLDHVELVTFVIIFLEFVQISFTVFVRLA